MTRFSIMTGIDPAKPATGVVEYARATERHGYEHEYPAHYRALLDEIRAQVPTIAYPEWQEPKWHLVPDDFVKYQLTVGTEAECIARIRELMAIEPDEIMFSSGFARPEQITQYASLVSRLRAA